MKQLITYINEKLVINKDTGKKHYKYFPETNDELQEIINQRIKEEGNECDLNDIDISKIDDMTEVFYYSKFNGDISEWNVSNVKNMNNMFAYSKFNGDISEWDVSNVIRMSCMFYGSKFNQDISEWDVSKVEDMRYIFNGSPLEGKEQKWWNKNKLRKI